MPLRSSGDYRDDDEHTCDESAYQSGSLAQENIPDQISQNNCSDYFYPPITEMTNFGPLVERKEGGDCHPLCHNAGLCEGQERLDWEV